MITAACVRVPYTYSANSSHVFQEAITIHSVTKILVKSKLKKSKLSAS